MTVEKLVEIRKMMFACDEIAWLLASNCIYHRVEQLSPIALFDTQEALEAYYQASLLPAPELTEEPAEFGPGKRVMTRFFKESSLLRNFNKKLFLDSSYCFIVTPMTDGIWDLPRNPAPPL